MLLTSFAEVLSVGAIVPFLSILTSPDWIFAHPYAQPLIKAMNFTVPTQLLLPIGLVFGAAAVLAGVMRISLLWISTRLSFATGADLSIEVYRRTLYQPYSVHCDRNSSDVINGIAGKVHIVINSIIGPTITLCSSLIMLIAILIALLLMDPLVALGAFGFFGSTYLIFIKLTRRRLLINSNQVARESSQVIKSLQEGLGGIRDVLLDGSQETFCKIYRSADLPLRQAQASSAFITASPRYAMEALGMLIISMLAIFLAQKTDGVAQAIPTLGALALGAQRLLPLLQQGYAAWSGIRGGQVSLQDTLELLEQPLPSYSEQLSISPLTFERSIGLKQLGFRYSEQTPYVLKDVNLTITKGTRVGFIGATGSGKSTLIDIVMGLLKPTDGLIEIDGQTVELLNNRAWQMRLAHVPQAIFLADGTLEENIAFGVPRDNIDYQRVRESAKRAQIAHTIESWREQYQTRVGERGIRLSGGQRQRIGIARALYKCADVIVFDEATSALDNETESSVMGAIKNLSDDLTVIIIAHRLTTLKDCDQIIELGSGRILRAGTYREIIKGPSITS
jgi:ABC-type multidrug transport system fused ATPase/permease subunit